LNRNLLYNAALAAGRAAQWMKALRPPRAAAPAMTGLPPGISVVIPSRNGKDLLAAALPGVERELAAMPSGTATEIVIVDNGSSDGSSDATAASFPRAVFEVSAAPLSFARAVNRGIRRARYSHVCLLNNDMLVEPGFFRALRNAFDRVPELFCSTAQIFFPPGARREETGKAVMARDAPTDFPVRCDLPIPGEDASYVLYGSGGCSLYDAGKLRSLGGVREIYEPAYVEDLDLGFRGWARGWPTVFAAGARVEHRHRATTSRYYTEEQLAAILEVNYLRFLTGAVASPELFGRLWREAVERLRLLDSVDALRFALRAPLITPAPVAPALPEAEFLALTQGDVAVFPGRAGTGRPVALIASPHALPSLPESGAAHDAVLIYSAPGLSTPPGGLLDLYVEVVQVKSATDSAAFHAALRQTIRKWRPELALLESTQMAQYAPDCAPVPAVLV
jgi:GT2 family glycosyltransferase